ncbi:alpha/beta fold hydrolase [Longispora sp. K20-0274]|uniref:alpha/beta fold hydrolase n=1 Tax=Longispora sp. K20-0274 TaxID=3088255 RepID=UPI00399AEAE7
MAADGGPRLVAGWALVAAGFTYTTWVLGLWVNPGVDARSGYVSSYAATDQPHRALFVFGDCATGVLVVLAVLLVALSRVGVWNTLATVGWLGLGLFGAGTVADSVLTLDCTPYTDATCALLERSGHVSLGHQLHATTSSLAVTGACVSLLAMALAWRRPWIWVLAVLELLAVAASLAAMLAGDWMGAAQRVQVGILAVWLVGLGAVVLSARPHRAPDGPGPVLGLHVVDEGSGEPAVLMVSGLGEAWFDWDAVAARLDTRVVRYDRPGLGLSLPESGPVTLAAEVDRLAEVGPARAVVVAHSFGAFFAEGFARRYPERVVGLVLVDPSCEPAATRRAGWWSRLLRVGPPVTSLLTAGLAPALGPWARNRAVRAQTVAGTAPGDREQVRAVFGSARVLGTAVKELLSYRDVAADLLALRAATAFPAVPVVVLTALGDVADPAEAAEWRDGHAALAALLGGRQEVLADARHMLQVDRPELVVAAIREVS